MTTAAETFIETETVVTDGARRRNVEIRAQLNERCIEWHQTQRVIDWRLSDRSIVRETFYGDFVSLPIGSDGCFAE